MPAAFGVCFTVRTYGELNDWELAAVMEEWKAMADSGWGEELFYRPIRTEKGDIYIGFWDTDNNDNLFIKTEEEFRRGLPGRKSYWAGTAVLTWVF